MTTKAEELILDRLGLEKFRTECKKNSKRVVLAQGVFDILHPGHLKFLEKSRECGDVLIVGINDDAFARTKGDDRPIQGEYDRAHLVAGFECVSGVHIFSDDMDLIQLVQPDFFIMSTATSETVEERIDQQQAVEELGGKIVVFDAFSTLHSTEIIEKLKISV
ncbi:MAG: adenylyltransferase/cytidyltransferase family protein [Sulfurimonadaceae bacterium]